MRRVRLRFARSCCCNCSRVAGLGRDNRVPSILHPTMTTHTLARQTILAVAAVVLCAALPAATAQTAPAKKPAAAKVAKKGPVKTAPAEPAPPAAATAEQIDAAERVFYGVYDCEFKQTIDISTSPKYPSYVDVRHGKVNYVMKPVLSSTGAIRLEDVRGDTLMVQIASKSMLLNVKTAQRIVDDCVSPKQRELIEAARAAKAATLASAAAPAAEASSASAPEASTTAPASPK